MSSSLAEQQQHLCDCSILVFCPVKWKWEEHGVDSLLWKLLWKVVRIYLPSSSKHKRCCTWETSNSCQWLLVSIFGWIIHTTWARKRPKSFGFGATATHLQLQHIIFLGHSTASCATVLLYQMKCSLQDITHIWHKKGKSYVILDQKI